MPKSSPTKKQPNQPFPHVPLPFDKFVKGLLQVDPKKLPSKKKAAKGKLTDAEREKIREAERVANQPAKKAGKMKGLSNRDNQAK